MATKRTIEHDPICIIILGCPGSGKGTQASLLKDSIGDDVEIISTGTLLSQHRETKTTLGRFVKENWGMNNLHDIALELAKQKILECKNQNKRIIMEGFPRTVEALLNLEHFLTHHEITVDLVIELHVEVGNEEDQEVIRKRIEGRKVHIPSGRVYHDDFNPPKEQDKDDVTGEILSSRHDDIQSALQTRLKSFSDHTIGVLKYYHNRGLLHSIDAKQPFAQVHKEILSLVTQAQQSSKKAKTDNNNTKPNQLTEFSSPLLQLFAQPIGLLESLELREMVAKLSKSQKISSFPGMHSVPLDHSSLLSIKYPQDANDNESNHTEPESFGSHYKVTLKLDGVRFLMLIHNGAVYLMDRKMYFYQCTQLSFSNQADGSLLDGELVMDRVKQVPVFVIFDAISFHGKPLLNSKLDYRLKSANTLLGHLSNNNNNNTNLPLLQHQKYLDLDSVPDLLELSKKPPSEEHPFEVDGLVFIPAKGKYRSGVNSKLFKWKPESNVTVDFLIKADTKCSAMIYEEEKTFYQLHIQYGSEIGFYDWICFPPNQPAFSFDQIAECSWNFGIESYVPSADWTAWEPRAGGWVLDRIRVDKLHPNPKWVVDSLVAYINDPVTEEKLLNAFSQK